MAWRSVWWVVVVVPECRWQGVVSEERLPHPWVQVGDILVASQTDIEFVPAMHRASAVVTETGSRFCHAAVWARENAKPTVLQVLGATSILAGLSLVTVNATAGTITWEDDQ